MAEHTDLSLWKHDFRSKISKVLTGAYSIRRIKKQRCYSELIDVAESLDKLFGELCVMTDEIFIELNRLTKED